METQRKNYLPEVTSDTEAIGVKNLGSGDRLTLVPVLAPPFNFQVSLTLSFFKGEIVTLSIPPLFGCYGCEMSYGSDTGEFLVCSKCSGNVSY